MSKAMLIEKLVEKKGITRRQAGLLVDDFTESLTELLSTGQTVTLIGFGKFYTKAVAERKGRNPATGKEMKITARTRVNFKAGKGLVDSVQPKKATRGKKK